MGIYKSYPLGRVLKQIIIPASSNSCNNLDKWIWRPAMSDKHLNRKSASTSTQSLYFLLFYTPRLPELSANNMPGAQGE
jgi:hypothetical protein